MRLLLTVLVLASAAVAQGVPESGRVAGVVTWDETGEPLIGANVFFYDLQRGAATDLEGRFEIADLPVGVHAVRVSYAGFEPFDAEVAVGAGDVVWLSAALSAAEMIDCWVHCSDPPVLARGIYAARVAPVAVPYRCTSVAEGQTEAVAR